MPLRHWSVFFLWTQMSSYPRGRMIVCQNLNAPTLLEDLGQERVYSSCSGVPEARVFVGL